MLFALQNAAIRNPDTRRVFLAQLLSQLGDKLMLVATLWYLAGAAPSRWVSWFLALSALPHLVMIPFAAKGIRALGGELRTVVVTDVIRGVALVIFGLAFTGLPAHFTVPALFVASALSNFLGSLFNPAMLSLPPRLSTDDRERQSATALLESCFSFAAILSPLLATGLYAVLGLGGVIAINGASYLVAAVLEARVRLQPLVETSSSGQNATSSAFDPVLVLMLACFFAMNLFLGPVLVFLPLFAKQVYSGDILALAGLESAFGTGTILGTLGLSVIQLPGNVFQKIIGSLTLVAGSYLAFAFSRTLGVGTVCIGLLGLFLAIANVVILGVFQTRPRPDQIVRLMSWVNLISVASLPISMTLVGLALDIFSLRSVALLCAGLLVAVTFVAALVLGWYGQMEPPAPISVPGGAV